jgi:ABC-2 type transport system ATP-binding protein
MSETAVRFESVSLSFGAVLALGDVSADIPMGTVAGIAGPDGAGKTTLMRLAVGLLAPSAGVVSVLGRELPREAAGAPAAAGIRADVGYLPQRLGLHGHMSVRENLEYFAALNGVTGKDAASRMPELLALTGLAAFERRLAQNLSGGMKQKLAFACAVLHRPRLVLLDEPTTGVDPLSRRDMWELIYGLLGEGARAGVVVATPSWEEAVRCQWLMVLDGGRVLTQAEPPALIESARDLVWELSAPPGAEQALVDAPWALSVGRRGTGVRVVVNREAGDRARQLLEQALPGSDPHRAAPGLEDAVVLLQRGRPR